MSLEQPELPFKVVSGKRSELRVFAAKVFERHGIALRDDDPAFALVTLNELILRKLTGELLKDVDQHMTVRLAEFEQTMQRVEERASKVLAQQVRESAGGLLGTLRQEMAFTRLDLQHTIAEIRDSLSRWLSGTVVGRDCNRGPGGVWVWILGREVLRGRRCRAVGSAANGQVRRVVRQRLEGLEGRQKERQLRREAWQEYYRIYNKAYRGEPDRTRAAVERQLGAMGAEIFEVGALQRGAGDQPHFMLLRTWDKKTLINSIPWLKYQNWHESHIYVRPKGESNLTLIDDLKGETLLRMREDGFQPAVVVETSPGNYQAWLKHSAVLDKELGTAVARELAARFGGDVKAADWRHFGRLAGFRNTKEKYKQVVAVPGYDDWRSQKFHRDLEGRWIDGRGNVHDDARLREIHASLSPTIGFPFVRLVETSGAIARESEGLVASVRVKLEQQRADRAQAQAQFQSKARSQSQGPLKGIEAFRSDPRYGGDGTRVDLAYAVYAVARGADLASVRAALGSRDLSHKGDLKRQSDYIERTIHKALASVEQGRGR